MAISELAETNNNLPVPPPIEMPIIKPTHFLRFNKTIGTGALIGFIAFVVLLESGGMGKILYREGTFRLGGLLLYLKSPFHQRFLWYPSCWKHNWVLMTSAGAMVGYVASFFL